MREIKRDTYLDQKISNQAKKFLSTNKWQRVFLNAALSIYIHDSTDFFKTNLNKKKTCDLFSGPTNKQSEIGNVHA